MGSDLHHPWVREEMMRKEHEEHVAKLEAERDSLRAALAEALDMAADPETEGYANALTKEHRKRVADLRKRFKLEKP